MRMIEADALIRKMDDYVTEHNALRDVERVDGVLIVKSFIDEQNTVDAVEVVRCKDCRWFQDERNEFTGSDGFCPNVAHGVSENWFCADGERRDE